jgi:alanyl-tRNA synthetase
MGVCMPAKQTVIDINEEQFKSILEKVEARIQPKPKQGMTLREAISKFKPTITKALKRGYTYEEVAAILTEEGISIKGATLKQYLAESKNKKHPSVTASATGTKASNPTAEDSALSDIKPDSKSVTPTNLEAETNIKAEAKSDIKPDTKPAAKTKSVVRGKFADIPSNDEL